MREIKFKFLLENKKTGEKIMSEAYSLDSIFGEDATEKIHEDLEGKHGCDGNCTNESVNHCECGPIFDEFEIINKSQYTGLKDKTGKEIYEGDIVKAASQGDHATLEIKWGQGTAGFFLYREYGALNWNLSGGGKNYDEESVEIIGTVHENSELLTTDI